MWVSVVAYSKWEPAGMYVEIVVPLARRLAYASVRVAGQNRVCISPVVAGGY